ncbi:MAG: amidophosphoribosyltransferase [Bacteroidales bacterium]|nr:amidophosphoribosyltransferase [Bacteroidales bacterium]
METLKHECGIAMIRLLKPLEYYQEKYGSDRYALDKLYLMMEKQHNRGQEGAGMACVKLNQPAGHEYMYREKAEGKDAITKVFASIAKQLSGEYEDGPAEITTTDDSPDASAPFIGELYMGHLRYSTTGKGGLKYVHPFLRRNNWKAKNLCICGNFNMTNISDVFGYLTELGQCPRVYNDSYITLEYMGHRLDREVERNFQIATQLGLEGSGITEYIDSHIDISNVLRTTMPRFDGGYVMCGLTGSGELFCVRDPHGIRPAFYYADDEIVAIASERPVLQTAFNLKCEDVCPIRPGEALIVNAAGEICFRQIMEAQEYLPCSFERIYFSRGNDRDIYQERKALGHNLTQQVLNAVGGDTKHTVVSYIPNTAEVAYYGLSEALRAVDPTIRCEKIVSKDIKLRTFITEGNSRNDLASHVYDITTGAIEEYKDNLVVIDDSIVRGTTLRESIIKILDRLHPKKIVIVSSAPQVRYPDFYGIDMSRIEDFIAFQSCMALLRERGMENLIDEVHGACRKVLAQLECRMAAQGTDGRAGSMIPCSELENPVRRLYEPFTAEEINAKMIELLRPEGVTTPIEFVYQSIEGLHKAIPDFPGDWYFTGHYPTPGGLRLLLRSFIDYCASAS